MTANATPNNRRPIRWWYLPTLVVTLFVGFAALTGASKAAAPLDVPGKAAPAGRTQPDACGPGANYVIVTGTTTLIPGTTDTGNHTDDGTTSIALPFPVTYYKRVFTSVNASSNGNLQFTSNLAAYANECLPTVTNAMNDLIAPNWGDLRTDQVGNCTLYGGVGCGIFTAVLGSAPNRQFLIEWRAVYFSPNTQRANFEVILYEGIDRIDMIYGLVDQGGSSATVGMQRDTGTTRFTQFECNTAGSLSTNLLLIYTPGPCVTDTPTNTITPRGPLNTPTQTSTPTCGPYSDYVITQMTGAQLVPGVNLVSGSQGDDVVAPIALPFTYHLYEYSPSTTVYASSNGNLQFSSADVVSNNSCLSNTSMNATIFPYWDNLRTDSALICAGGCGIYTSLSGNVGNRIFTIEWRAVYANNTAQQANFEVRLYEAEPKFEIIYGTVDQSGSSATVGVEHCVGWYTQFECNTGVLTSGMALIFQQPPCGTATATSTSASPTNTPTNTNTSAPTNTFTPIPPTNTFTFTPIPPTNTFTPTNTPTNTNTSVPTNTFTPVPPTSTPTNTNTSTPTNTPAANIVGHVTWQGVAAANRPLVTGTLTLCVGGAPQNFSFTTDTNGNFTITTGLPDGLYNWMVKGGRHVTKSSPSDGTALTISGGSGSQEFGTLKGGDTNADNVVNSTDFAVLRNDFGHAGVDRADFDYNLVVSSSDFSILKTNFGQSGHSMTCP